MVLPVADAAAKPLWLYHIPALTHVPLDPIELCRALLRRCPSFAGVKFTVADLLALQAMLEASQEGWQVAWGCDELMLPALAMGARSFMGSTYNYAAPAYLRLMEAFERGDHETARRISRQIQPLLDLLGERGDELLFEASDRGSGAVTLHARLVSADVHHAIRKECGQIGRAHV